MTTEFQRKFDENGPLTMTCHGCQKAWPRDHFAKNPRDWSRMFCFDCEDKIGTVSRATREDVKRLTVYVPFEVMKALRGHCSNERVSLSKFTTEAIKTRLEKGKL